MKYKINYHKTALKINSYMIKNDISISYLADYLNESASAVIKWTTGKSKPSVEFVASISILFNVSINDLIVLEESK